ncbi:MAG: hypothetical protein NVSMB9_30570 [Isosphaeraceae bacterium]
MPLLVITASFMGISLGTTLALALLCVFWRRRLRAEREETARRLNALAERVSRLETREEDPLAASPTVTTIPSTNEPAQRPHPAQTSGASGPTLISVPNLATTRTAAPAASDLTHRFGAICELADAGEPAGRIARVTGQPIGQVELILGLRRQLASSGTIQGPGPSDADARRSGAP